MFTQRLSLTWLEGFCGGMPSPRSHQSGSDGVGLGAGFRDDGGSMLGCRDAGRGHHYVEDAKGEGRASSPMVNPNGRTLHDTGYGIRRRHDKGFDGFQCGRDLVGATFEFRTSLRFGV